MLLQDTSQATVNGAEMLQVSQFQLESNSGAVPLQCPKGNSPDVLKLQPPWFFAILKAFNASSKGMQSIKMVTLNVINQTRVNLSVIIDTVDLEMKFSKSTNILIMTLVSLVIFLTVSGNFLVMFAFITDKRLRTQSNFFLLNLAICDFYIGAFSTPLYLPYMLTGKWMPGKIVCKLWLTIDYTLCTASAFNVVLISYDRFLSVTKAVLYRSQQNRHSHTVRKMATVWILSFLLYGPAILFWDKIFGGNHFPDDICVADFFDTWYFNFGTSIFDFVLPLIGISFFNLSIYWNIKARSKKKRNSSAPQDNQKSPYVIETNTVLFAQSLQQNEHVCVSYRKRIEQFYIRFKGLSSSPTNNRLNSHDVQTIQLSRDKKVAKSLLILVCVFTICWAPYSFLITIGKVCDGYCIDSYWYESTLWLLYTNSAINPILYPLCHKSFRNAFLMMFKMCLKNCH
ncbi:histamine H3 receptor-like [Pelobates fuscus]|uniref:histamine H3 receptor-like n=1 Tax=Pelobates fuscus TaxID=191477 RepID=UPI002FE45698